ncbi:MAG: glgB [Burkholderiales bacterium]|jgi:1,4-alpha-glucan branching enzyme|nr:glgB [Burkholderiales bacterium]
MSANYTHNKTAGIINDTDIYLFHEGRHFTAYNFMGAHKAYENNIDGIRFTTWAPNALSVCVIGDFCHWQMLSEYYMQKISNEGLWSIFIPDLQHGIKYKFAVTNRDSGHMVYKSDPYAISSELRPNTASIINTQANYAWSDDAWLSRRVDRDIFSSPMNVYEVHLGSWKTKNGQFLSYEELINLLPAYVKEMGYTHVEFMPLNEHPLDASWGYQGTGFFSVNSRHGDLRGLKHLVNELHKLNIGVILDWVPGHFCVDAHGLINFDGSPCYEYQASWKAQNTGWGTRNFDLGRFEVKSFLISNAMYWINEFHIDGLRVDAVSNILYLDYGREPGQWQPNIFGNNQNLEGINFLKEFNHVIKTPMSGVVTIAEESSAWTGITTKIEHGGLGFDLKWNMGWMNDTLRYIKLDPVHRKYHHNLITFSMHYNYSEKFILPISHDEVVHGKKSLLDKMWGNLWNKFAGLRLYATYMMGHPGKKLLFMGSEFGQFVEWREYEQLQWQILDEFHTHKETQLFFKQLNHFYRENNALWEYDYDPCGFSWIDVGNKDQSVLSFARFSKTDCLIFICNFTPVVYYDYHIGVPKVGYYKEVFNSDGMEFGGSGQIIDEKLTSVSNWQHNYPQHLTLKIPPMAVTVLKHIG